MNALWDLIFLSVLRILFSLPLLTAGAASTAAYYAMAKSVRHRQGSLFREFWSSFRLNLKQSLLFSAAELLLLALLLFNCIGLWNGTAEGSRLLLYVQYALILTLAAVFSYFWPCLSRFSDSSLSLLRRAVLMAFRHIPSTILLLLVLALTLIGIWLMPWAVFILPGLALLADTFLMEPLLLKYSPVPEEGSPESRKWYYQ